MVIADSQKKINNANNKTTDSIKPRVESRQMYLKENTFERINKAEPSKAIEPNTEMNVMIHNIAKDEYEVVLSLRITGKQESVTLFILKVEQAGHFAITGFEEKNLHYILNGVCVNYIYPYACESVNSILVHGGLPALPIAPVNFEALYQQERQQEKQENQHL